jgi:hypothetical protein
MATLQGHGDNPANGFVLDLLVLWRGSPGWFDDSRDQIAAGGSDGIHRVNFSGRTIQLQFDAGAHTVRFQGQAFSLRDANAVLIDDVDKPGARIAGSVKVNSPLPGNAGQSGANQDPFTMVIRRSVALFEFLRCDASFSAPDPNRNQTLRYCAQMRP